MVWDTQQSEVLILPRTLNVSPTLYEPPPPPPPPNPLSFVFLFSDGHTQSQLLLSDFEGDEGKLYSPFSFIHLFKGGNRLGNRTLPCWLNTVVVHCSSQSLDVTYVVLASM